MDETEDLLNRADELNRRIDARTEQVIADAIDFGKKNRRLVHWLFVVVGAMVVVMVVLIFAIVKIIDNANAISEGCKAINASNANQILLWEHILQLSPTSTETPEEKAQKVEFEKYVQDTFKALDCKQPRVFP